MSSRENAASERWMPSRDFATCSGVSPSTSVRVREREVPLDRLHLARRAIELAGDRDVERPAAPVEHARKLAVEPGRDGDRRAVVADRDGDEPAGRLVSRRRSLERAQQGERLEVDPDDLQAGASARLQVAIDDLAVGDDEEDALPRRCRPRARARRGRRSRARPRRAGSEGPPRRGSGSRSRAAARPRRRRSRRCARRSGCSRRRAERRASEACGARRSA